jgi:hypothetical protein
METTQLWSAAEIGYRWLENSCWLDTSLQLLCAAIMPDGVEELHDLQTNLSPHSKLSPLFDHFLNGLALSNSANLSEARNSTNHVRDVFRNMLVTTRMVRESA